MAAALPAKLKIPEITRFVTRRAQLEKYKPIVSYWCDYYVVRQILDRGLHTADDDCMTYTTNLMDKLEQIKNESDGNDAIVDDVAAKAYIEQFALETFQRGDDAIHSNRASRQTVDTFQAAATFIDLLTVWGPLDPEMATKSKYAKYHALRIVKAIKAGEDPNASNPVREATPVPTPGAELDGQDPSGAYRPPTVESAPDSMQPSRPTSIAPASPGLPPQNVQTAASPAVSHPGQPISPAESAQANSRQGSVGGGYFPTIPTFTSESAAPSLPTADSDAPAIPPADGVPNLADQPPTAPDGIPTPHDFYNVPAPVPPPAQPSIPPAAPIPQPQPVPVGSYRTDDDSIALAQKHAKWAQSALNFEDVDTAVKELRLALSSLGAL